MAFGKGNSPAADPAGGGIDERHQLAAAAVVFSTAQIVQFARYAGEKAADGLAVLFRNAALPFPEIPVTDAFVVADVQEFVGGDGDKIGFDFFMGLLHAGSSCAYQVTVKGAQNGAEGNGLRVCPVLAWGHAVGFLKGTGEGFVAGKTIVQCDLQKPFFRIPHLF